MRPRLSPLTPVPMSVQPDADRWMTALTPVHMSATTRVKRPHTTLAVLIFTGTPALPAHRQQTFTGTSVQPVMWSPLRVPPVLTTVAVTTRVLQTSVVMLVISHVLNLYQTTPMSVVTYAVRRVERFG